MCRRAARLEHHGCADCTAKYGERFVEVAARVRRDPQLAAMVLAAIEEPSHKELFVRYFGADGDVAPPKSRRRSIDGLR